jgi:hypothetical protein
MWEDPVVKEVHETRARILARFDGDFHAYVKYVQALEAHDQARGVEYVPTAPSPPTPNAA